jgi:4-diphosphocytidyl-2-C-methyl-D-erythritol kinase
VVFGSNPGGVSHAAPGTNLSGVAVRIPALAKVNLFLRVLTREENGYHGIETLLCLIDLADTVQVERLDGRGVTIAVIGPDLGAADQNLAARAATAVLDSVGHPFAIHVTLTKRIPVRAGLGGGSSDAAAGLHAANRLAQDAIPRHELLQIGARLGSDVPFFVTGAPLALAWNRGERMLRLPPLPPAPALLLTPPVPVATADAYGWLDAARGSSGRRGAVALDLNSLSGWGDVARMAGNDLESPVFGRHAGIRSAFEALVATGPLLCRMTGSGSTLFSVYRNARDREDAIMMLGRKHGTLTPVETVASAAPGLEQIPPT